MLAGVIEGDARMNGCTQNAAAGSYRYGFRIPRSGFSDLFFGFNFDLLSDSREYKSTILIYLSFLSPQFCSVHTMIFWVFFWFNERVFTKKKNMVALVWLSLLTVGEGGGVRGSSLLMLQRKNRGGKPVV